jgi:predicted transcriptional regulator
MKAITINVSDSIYQDFAHEAKRVRRPTAELIRQAMERFHEEKLMRRTSLRDLRPFDAGGLVQPISPDDDVLGEMLDRA